MNACQIMPPRGPGISPKAPNLERAAQFPRPRHFGTKHAILSSIVKENVRFFFVVRIVFG